MRFLEKAAGGARPDTQHTQDIRTNIHAATSHRTDHPRTDQTPGQVTRPDRHSRQSRPRVKCERPPCEKKTEMKTHAHTECQARHIVWQWLPAYIVQNPFFSMSCGLWQYERVTARGQQCDSVSVCGVRGLCPRGCACVRGDPVCGVCMLGFFERIN